MWENLIKVPTENTVKQAAAKPRAVNPLTILNTTNKQASSLLAEFDKKETIKKADSWFKEALVDASQMGGGGMPPGGAPPMDPAMMGGMPPVDPAAMGMMPSGGAPPMPMDPSMLGGGMPPVDPAMMGGMPPAPMPTDPAAMGGAVDPALMGPNGKKMKAEEVIVQQCSAIKELLYGLYTQLGLNVPISAVDEQAAARAIVEQNQRNDQEKLLEDTSRINPIKSLAAPSEKIGNVLELLEDTSNKLSAIRRFMI